MSTRSTTRTLTVGALIGAFAIGGCASLNNTERGGLIGAAAGAAAGAAIGDNTAKGAIIGAALGGTAGAIIGRRMDQKAEELRRQLDNATVERVGEGILITFDSGILFDFDSAALRPEARTNLAQLAVTLEDMEDDAVLMVAGHTDSVGDEIYNLRLSERRAEAAANFVVSAGLPRGNVQAVGLGETEPVATNETEAGRQENRRVEVAIYASEEYQQEVLSRGGS
ncbi:MAG TPA: OmpA family protein [Longimicrobiales bacterium]|nr:OmpA family protein [Longimicrobiales bacterium]